MALETKPNLSSNTTVKATNTGQLYSPMMTSQAGKHCQMRFFYFINGEPISIAATHLDIYIRYASKLEIQSKPILRLRLNIQGDLQQRWNKAVSSFQSTAPFQFVFRGVLGTSASRIAVDDLSFDPSGCVSSQAKPMTTTVKPSVTTNSMTQGPTTTATSAPIVDRKPSKSSGMMACEVMSFGHLLIHSFHSHRWQNRSSHSRSTFRNRTHSWCIFWI